MIVYAKLHREPSLTHWITGRCWVSQTVVDHCCPQMERAWVDGYIHFGDWDTTYNTNDHVCIYRCDPYPEGAVWTPMAISHCPFCGQVITIEIEE